jgi:hypothetical protein
VWVEAEVAHVENKDKEGKDERSIQDARKEDTNDPEDAGAYGKNDDRGIKAELAHRWLVLVVECQKPKTDMLCCCCSAAETDAMFLNMFDKLFVFVVFSIICVLVLFLYTK